MSRVRPNRRSVLLGALAGLAATTAGRGARAEATTLRIGATAGPHAQILEAVRPVAARQGIDLRIIEFSDYITPNIALDSGDLQANSYQHRPFLNQQIKDRGYKIEAVAETVTFPLGIYSRRWKRWADVPDGAQVAIQNDPTNGGRSLLLLAEAKVIELRAGVGLLPTLLDVVGNPHKLRFVEIDAAQAPRALDDVDVAAVNTNFALPAKLSPSRDALLLESPKGPYVNLLAVRSVDRDKPWVRTLVDSYRSAEVKAFILATFDSSVLPGW
jgi:D-methionine transport system substrate-binding protein